MRLWRGVLPHRSHRRVFNVASLLIYSLSKQLRPPRAVFKLQDIFIHSYTHHAAISVYRVSCTRSHTNGAKVEFSFSPEDYSISLARGLQSQKSNCFLIDR